MKCLPLKYFTNGFGAVKLTNTAGIKLDPGPDDGGPSSMFQDEGASTDVTGMEVSWRALITAGKGSRTSPEKENPIQVLGSLGYEGEGDEPKIASTTWSVSLSAVVKSSMKGILRFLSWVDRRYVIA
jgi:hypothetical protein